MNISPARFSTLPATFYTRLPPTPVPQPYLVASSASAAKLIGLDPREFESADFTEFFSGNRLLAGSEPLAAVYSGHQFGVWAGQLGDGRAHLLGEREGCEIQLKGAGRTPYSRMGDGRAVLRSSIREFLCSEAMAGLGIPTTRALCVVGSDLLVRREQMETAALVTRLAPSFIRFGSFEHWAASGNNEALCMLADFTLKHYFPELQNEAEPYAALLAEVSRRTALLMAQWQAVGFMHGVMNTDNMSILGLTLDYGPFGFMEAFNADHICNHSDHSGRYRFRQQPEVARWNLYALGQALVPLIGSAETAQDLIEDHYTPTFESESLKLWRTKLGLQTELPNDLALIQSLFELLQQHRPDYTRFFRGLSALPVVSSAITDAPVRDLFIDRAACDVWLVQWRARLMQEHSQDAARQAAMQRVNPKYVLRNYLAEQAIRAAQQKDFSEIARLLQCLERPYDEQPEFETYAQLPPSWANELEVSCSS